VRFQVPFLGPESQLKSSFFQIYMLFAKINAVVIFCLLQGSAFAVDFAIFAVSFLVPPDGPKKWDRGSAFFCSFLSCACGPSFGTVFRFIFEVFCIRVAEAQSFGFNETLWLMATGRANIRIETLKKSKTTNIRKPKPNSNEKLSQSEKRKNASLKNSEHDRTAESLFSTAMGSQRSVTVFCYCTLLMHAAFGLLTEFLS